MEDNLGQETVEKSSGILEKIRREHPLVHNITNYVVMNFTANALVINIGTLSQPWIDSMAKAARAARGRSIPIVLDPVGAGATRFRTEAARRLIDEAPVAVLRGNASEILAVAGQKGITRGVESVHGTEDARLVASNLAKTYGTFVAVTGAEDFVTDSLRMARISNGHPLMGRVTGTGCAASAITGAFCAVETDAFAAAIGALVTFGIAGELAALPNPGPGSFQVGLLDALDAIDGAIIRARAKVAFS